MITLFATPLGTFNGLGPLGNIVSKTDAFVTFTTVISTTIGVVTTAAGIYFIVQFFQGSYQWLTSGGDKQAVENARKRLTHAVIGLMLVVLSYALISVVGLVFGFNILTPLGYLY